MRSQHRCRAHDHRVEPLAHGLRHGALGCGLARGVGEGVGLIDERPRLVEGLVPGIGLERVDGGEVDEALNASEQASADHVGGAPDIHRPGRTVAIAL